LPVTITGTPAQIAAAIGAFPPQYHADFFRVRPLGQAYATAATPRPANATLAPPLQAVLRSWGAGKRAAPALQSVTQIASNLSAAPLHAALGALHNLPICRLTVTHNRRSFIGVPTTPAAMAAYDAHLFSALRTLAGGLFVSNTNVTYPMKAALLITGLMPAFDNQVRRGLQRGGFSGMNKTQYLLPINAASADGKKLTRLPFLLGQCWRAHSPNITTAISTSGCLGLLNEPGRFFDVLFFMQGVNSNPVLISYHGPQNWYNFA